jgi:hypothetical protein
MGSSPASVPVCVGDEGVRIPVGEFKSKVQSKVGNFLAKAAALRITINIDGTQPLPCRFIAE